MKGLQCIYNTLHHTPIILLTAISILISISISSIYHYQFFHSFLKVYTIVLPVTIFFCALHIQRFSKNHFSLFLGISYFFIGTLNILQHIFDTSSGIPFIGKDITNQTTQLWITSRFLESCALITAPLFFTKKVRVPVIYCTYFLIYAVSMLFIFIGDIPDIYFVYFSSVSFLNTLCQYSILTLLSTSLVVVYTFKSIIDRDLFIVFFFSIIFTILSEVSFSNNFVPRNLFISFGYSFRLLSLYLIYKAIILTNLVKPFNSISHELFKSKEYLQKAHDELECRIEERTAQLQQSEQKLRMITETIDDVFWISTPGITKIIYVSPAFEDIWKRPRKEVYEFPQSFIEAIHPEDKPKITKGIVGHAEGKWNYEYRIILPDSSLRWIRDRGYPVVDENGNLIAMVGTSSDITALKNMEDELRRSNEELEQRVQARTNELVHINQMLEQDIQYRIMVEAELLNSQERFKSIVEQSYDGIALLDRNGCIVLWNRGMENITGLKIEGIHQKRVWDILPELIIPNKQLLPLKCIIKESLETFFSTGAAPWLNQLLEHTIIRPDKKKVIVQSHLFLLHINKELTIGAIVRDITMQKNIEKINIALNTINHILSSSSDIFIALQKSINEATVALEVESGMLMLWENGRWFIKYAQGISTIAPDDSYSDNQICEARSILESGNPVIVNSTSQANSQSNSFIFNYSIKSYVAIPLCSLFGKQGIIFLNNHTQSITFNPNHIEFANKLMIMLSLFLERASLIKRLEDELNERRIIEAELLLIRKELENKVVQQSTEIIDTRQSLNETEKELMNRHQALEAVYAMATAFDSSLEILFDQVALSIAHLLQVPFTSICRTDKASITVLSEYNKGTLSHSIPLPNECPIYTTELLQKEVYTLYGDLTQQFPHSACFKNSEFCAFLTVPIFDHQGKIINIICVRDCKDRSFKQHEIHLIQIFGRYITNEISRRKLESQLRHAQEMKLLGQLTSGVAHEVRNPLNAIMSITEALFDEIGCHPEYQPFMNHISNQVERLSVLMEDLLALGRPIREESLQLLPIPKLLNSIVTMWQENRYSDNTVMLHVPAEAVSWRVKVDFVKIQQVFLNLLTNAAQHCSEKTSITLTVTPPKGTGIKIKVTDKGPGIPQQNLDRIFEPFFTTRKKGTGLGLSIVRHIIESHDGTIVIYNNTPKPGLTAEISLPVFLDKIDQAVS